MYKSHSLPLNQPKGMFVDLTRVIDYAELLPYTQACRFIRTKLQHFALYYHKVLLKIKQEIIRFPHAALPAAAYDA